MLTASFNADLVVLAGFMKLVGPVFLEAFPDRVVNAHPSLLPAFPGMHAPADALAHGVKLTGCTVFLVDGGIDAGPIVAQRAVPVLDDDDVDIAARADQGRRADAAGRGGRRADQAPATR